MCGDDAAENNHNAIENFSLDIGYHSFKIRGRYFGVRLGLVIQIVKCLMKSPQDVFKEEEVIIRIPGIHLLLFFTDILL